MDYREPLDCKEDKYKNMLTKGDYIKVKLEEPSLLFFKVVDIKYYMTFFPFTLKLIYASCGSRHKPLEGKTISWTLRNVVYVEVMNKDLFYNNLKKEATIDNLLGD